MWGRGDPIEILLYDHRGQCRLVSRLDEATFSIAHSVDGKAMEITHRELACLLANATTARSRAFSLRASVRRARVRSARGRLGSRAGKCGRGAQRTGSRWRALSKIKKVAGIGHAGDFEAQSGSQRGSY
jgi:hypothetical protein